MLEPLSIIEKFKKETNNNPFIVYREKKLKKKKIYIIFNDSLISNDKISDFIIRSLDKIDEKGYFKWIKNNLDSCKYKEVKNYDDFCKYVNNGFTVLLIENENIGLAFETKGNLNRSISMPTTENAIRGAKDSLIEDYQTNIGLIKKRMRSNDFWINELTKGKYTKTKIGICYINGIVKKELVKKIEDKINSIDIDGIITSDDLKKHLEEGIKSILPTITTTERPDRISKALLRGKVVIIIDNSEFALIVPGLFVDFFKAPEDWYGNSINVSITRIIKYISFFIAILTPAFYIAMITYNQEIIPTDLLISFSVQRNGVPFPAFIEAFLMILAFEIIKESEYRVPNSSGSALSIVGALILGDAAVSAGIVSPIMIIVIAITAISSLPFSEPEFTTSIRTYRLIFMIGGSLIGIVGIVAVLIFLLIRLTSIETFDIPFLSPIEPFDKNGFKNTFIKMPQNNKRMKVLSNNITRGDSWKK